MPKIIRFYELGEADVLKVEEAPLQKPGAGEVRLKVEAIGFNRSDLLFRRGVYPEKPTLPSSLGYDASGVIDAVGEGVAGFKIGDRVSTFTNFSLLDYTVHGESAILPARSVTPTPANLSPEEGAAFWNPFLTAYAGLAEAGQLCEGKTVLMTAASSSIGAAAVQICKSYGAKFIATTRTQAKKKLLQEWGADHVVVTADEDLASRVSEITGRRGVDIVFDSIGGPDFEKFGQMVAVRGRLISFGSLTRQPPSYPMQAAMLKQFTFEVMTLFTYTGNPHFNSDERPVEVTRAKRFILDGLALGTLRPTIGKVFRGLDQYVAATKFVESNQSTGKVVLRL
jgi:NADPH:quinone reductase-like Zn-dependent oxidoreductase